MESFHPEGFENSEPTQETPPPSWPGREAMLQQATEKVVADYLERSEAIVEELEANPIFTTEKGKPKKIRHLADRAVAEAQMGSAKASALANESAEANDGRNERIARVLVEMFEHFKGGFHRFGEVYDNNPEAARQLAQRHPYLQYALETTEHSTTDNGHIDEV